MVPLGGSPDIPRAPHPPTYRGLADRPSIIPDVPMSAVFLCLFMCAAVAHLGLFQVNLRRGKRKFGFNAATFAFCFSRIVATSLRIAWACYPRNASLSLSTQIFVFAGTPILFFCNLFWAQRIVRAQHPHFGWSKPFSIWLPILNTLAVLTILSLISAIVVQFYIPNAYTQSWTRAIQLYGATFLGITALLPIPIELLSAIAKTYPTIKDRPVDNFGSGNLRSKIIISILSALVLSLGAWYRAITSYLNPLPIDFPTPWYFSKPSFYIFNFTTEILVVLFWLIIRVDKRFIIPDGAKGAFSYANGFIFAGEPGNEKKRDRSTKYLSRLAAETPPKRSSTSTLPDLRLSRVDSWGSLTRHLSRDVTPGMWMKHVSWGGISRDKEDPPFGADGEEISRADETVQRPARVAGVKHELGFDPKSGRWEIRRLSEGEYLNVGSF